MAKLTLVLDSAPKRKLKSESKSKHGTAWAVIRDPATARYLLTRRAKGSNNAGQWGFPGGGVDAGESEVEALVRECSEEMGVTLSATDLHAVMSREDTDTVWFEMFRKVKGVKTAEIDSYKWVYPWELDQYNLHKSVRHYFKALTNQIKFGRDSADDTEE